MGAPRLSGPRATPGGRLATGEAARARRPGAAAAARYPLPLAKLRGVPSQARAALKVGRITTCDQLLAAAAVAEDREALARATKIAPEILADLVRRADMARVDGVGAVFGLMLEELGIRDVEGLANQDAETLHERLRGHNRRERLARRSPTPEEVNDWIGQARGLPRLVTYGPPAVETAVPGAAAEETRDGQTGTLLGPGGSASTGSARSAP